MSNLFIHNFARGRIPRKRVLSPTEDIRLFEWRVSHKLLLQFRINETRNLFSWGNLFPRISTFLVTGRKASLTVIILYHKQTDSHIFYRSLAKSIHLFPFFNSNSTSVQFPARQNNAMAFFVEVSLRMNKIINVDVLSKCNLTELGHI